MPVDQVSLQIMAIRKGELPNAKGEFPCGDPGCECRFFSELDVLLHRKRGQHGQMSFMDTFRRIRGNYAGTRPKEAAYAKQSRLQAVIQGTSPQVGINSPDVPDPIEPHDS